MIVALKELTEAIVHFTMLPFHPWLDLYDKSRQSNVPWVSCSQLFAITNRFGSAPQNVTLDAYYWALTFIYISVDLRHHTVQSWVSVPQGVYNKTCPLVEESGEIRATLLSLMVFTTTPKQILSSVGSQSVLGRIIILKASKHSGTFTLRLSM